MLELMLPSAVCMRHRVTVNGGQWSQDARRDDVWSPRSVRVVDVLPSQRVSSGEVRQRWSSVCSVTTEQDAQRGRREDQVYHRVQSRLSITVSGHQLPTDDTTLWTLLLRAVFLRPSTRLLQLQGCKRLPAAYQFGYKEQCITTRRGHNLRETISWLTSWNCHVLRFFVVYRYLLALLLLN